MQTTRGKIRDEEKAKQLRDYSGLCFGTITPTDIDGLIEYHNIGYVIMELKYGNSQLDAGQELALKRLTDDLATSGKNTICIIASHETKPEFPIDVANTQVIRYRHGGKWHNENNNLTTRKLIERFLNYLG